MSSHDDDDITRIEDLPDFNPAEEDEDFTSLEDMATELGLEALEDDDETPPPNPEYQDNENEDAIEPANEPTFETGKFESPSDFDQEMSFDSSFDGSEEDEEDSPDSFDDFGQNTDFENFDSSDEVIQAAPENLETNQAHEVASEDVPEFSGPELEDEVEPEEKVELNEPIEEDSPAEFNQLEDDLQLEADPSEPIASEAMEERPIEAPTPQLTSMEELIESHASVEPEPPKTEIERETLKEWQQPVNFNDIKSFAEQYSTGDFSAEGNPPFSIIIKNLKYYEDVAPMVEILHQHKLIDDPDYAQEKLVSGQMLIPRLSEYAAILICHKLRVYDCEILMGLTEEIHPAQSYESNDRGLVNRRTVYQNKRHHLNFEALTNSDTIMTSTLDRIDGFSIREHLGVITQSRRITSDDIVTGSLEDEILQNVPEEVEENISDLRLRRENIKAAESEVGALRQLFNPSHQVDPSQKLEDIYSELVDELKHKAINKQANGVVGINFSITPVAIESYLSQGPQYQILCTGNLVWLEKA